MCAAFLAPCVRSCSQRIRLWLFTAPTPLSADNNSADRGVWQYLDEQFFYGGIGFRIDHDSEPACGDAELGV
jgi:hypothetical protein